MAEPGFHLRPLARRWLRSPGLGGDPAGRCVFSALDRRARIRCHLHRFAKAHGLERHIVQPLPCRLFPLVLVDLESGRVALTTIYPRTSRLVGAPPASRLPCLADPSHPPLVQTLASDLDWLFGPGFARTLRSRALVITPGGRP